MKKLFYVFSLLAMISVSLGFVACDSDDDGLDIVTYSASGETSYSGSDMSAIYALANYNSAINKYFGGDNHKVDDAGVKKVCDAVYEGHKAKYGSDLTGTVKILRKQDLKDGEYRQKTTIAEYTY